MGILIRIARAFLSLIYAFLKLFKTQDKIVFLSRQSDIVSIDFRLMADEIKRSHPEYKTVMLCRKIPSGIVGKIKYSFHMLRQMYHLATSRAAILDSYCIPVSLLRHKKELAVIQIWHALGNMKKFGYAMLDKPEGSDSKLAKAMCMHKNYDCIVISSMSFAKDFLEGFNANPKLLAEIPLPRTDILTDSDKAKNKRSEIMQKYPVLEGKKNILYCPTFRKSDSQISQAVENLSRLIDRTKYNFIVSYHPVSESEKIDDSKALNFAESTFDLLFASDFVISDYSTVFYEAGLLKKPIFSYSFDWEQYHQRREINFDIEHEFPGLFTDDAEQIIGNIEQGIFDFERLEAFIEKNVAVGSGHCTERLISLVFDKINEKSKIKK